MEAMSGQFKHKREKKVETELLSKDRAGWKRQVIGL